MKTHQVDIYTPPMEILDAYAEVLVDYALNSGQGVRPNEVVRLVVSETAKPLFLAIRNKLLSSGAHPLTFYQPDGVSREFFELANSDQLKFFPRKLMKGLVDDIDHSIAIISETDKHELEGINPAKIMSKVTANKPLKNWLDKKENLGKFTWTLALWGTEAMATEAGLTLKEYWGQIISACFLDYPNPIAKWREISIKTDSIRNKLNRLSIDKIHIFGKTSDLWITLGKNRQWLGGSGRNIPSFEIFTSPDWRGTKGWIDFNQPLYYYGNLITNVHLEFKAGRVVKSSASKNYSVLEQMLKMENADKVGEFSLTDRRISRITKFMAETLYDENISGPFGNTHIALGSAYADTYTKDIALLSRATKDRLGFNDSAIHTDIVSTTDRTVTAELTNGSTITIYKSGQFVI